MSAPPVAPDDARARFIQRFMGHVPHVTALGIRYLDHGVDWAELELPYDARLVGYPDFGTLANGAVFSLVDSCAGFAVFVATGNLGHATLDLRLDYLGAPAAGSTVVARMTCYRRTSRVAFVHGVAHAGDPARPVAAAAGTFMITGAA